MTGRGRGGAPPSPVLVRAVELLADREWHDFETVLRELAKLIPPGVAIRRAKSTQAAGLAARGRTELDGTRGTRSDERLIESGKRQIVREIVSRKHFESEPKGSPTRIRLVTVPGRVVEYAGSTLDFEPGRVADELVDAVTSDAAVAVVLDRLTHAQVELVAVELAGRLYGD